MSVVEYIKDWFGILDDADDFRERSSKIRGRLDRILSSLESDGKKLVGQIERVESGGDIKVVAAYIRTLTGVEDEIEPLLKDDLRNVDDLISEARSKDFKGIVPELNSLKKDIIEAMRKNKDLIREADELIRTYNRIKREENVRLAIRVILSALGGLLASVLASKVLNNGLSTRVDKLQTVVNHNRQQLERMEK